MKCKWKYKCHECPLSHFTVVAYQQKQQTSSTSSSSCWETFLLLWKAQFQESKRYKFSSYLGPDSRGEGFQYLEESVWGEKYIFMEELNFIIPLLPQELKVPFKPRFRSFILPLQFILVVNRRELAILNFKCLLLWPQ